MSPRPSAPAVLAGTILMLLTAAIAAPTHASVTSGGEQPMLDAQFDRDLMHRLKRKLDIVQPDRQVAHTNQPPSAPLRAPAPRGGIDLIPDLTEQAGAIRMTDPIGAPLPLDPGGFITGDPPLPGLPGPTAAVLGPLTGSPAWTGLGPEVRREQAVEDRLIHLVEVQGCPLRIRLGAKQAQSLFKRGNRAGCIVHLERRRSETPEEEDLGFR